ncbi:MAG TPA: hypothetical protein VFR02_02325, partial [bacterium]|nr:hypothetical protein [bacterium]
MAPVKPSPTAVVPTATPTPQPEVEEFAYTLLENQKPSLWTMDTDGTNAVRLSPPGVSCWYPLWSPSGKKLAYLSDQADGKINLFILDKGGKTPQQVTFYDDMSLPAPGTLKAPLSWSPKSDQVAYIYHKQVWVVDLTAQTTRSVFTPGDPSYSISDIEWAPYRDNKSIAF